MHKFWLVFANEYKRHVLRKRFIFAILSMPIFLGFMALVSFLAVWTQYSREPVGYIAPAGLLDGAQPVPDENDGILPSVEFVRYQDESQALADVRSKKLQAYFILSNDYLESGNVTLIKGENSGSNVEDDFSKFLKYNLLANTPANVVQRLTEGTELIVRSADGSREMGMNNWLAILLPILTGVLFLIAVNVSGNYLLQAVVEEKENRTMEILVTSVSPTQLMAGKIFGDLLVGLTELAAWVLFALLGFSLVPNWLEMGQSVQVKPSLILLMAAIYLPAFVMIAAAMGAVGSTATESREAQQVAGLFTLPIIIPFWFTTSIIFDPSGPIATGLSIFPLTAPIAMPLRLIFVTVPVWQIVLTVGMLDALAVLMVWFSGRIFRIGMLQYGKRVTFKQIFARRATVTEQR